MSKKNNEAASATHRGQVHEMESLDLILISELLADWARDLGYPDVAQFWTSIAAAEAGKRITWEKPTLDARNAAARPANNTKTQGGI